MKLFKNKFFIIVLSIAIFSVIFTSTLSIMGKTDPIKNFFGTVATPFRYVGIKIKESFEGFSKYFSSVDGLVERNSELESEIDKLGKELADSKAIEEENERLRKYIEVKKTYPDFEFLEALIVGNESENHSSFFTLNKGSGDGVKLGMPIVNEIGVIGSVCEVGYSWCRVRVLTEASSSVGAYISRSGETGVIDGDISMKDTGNCILSYLSEDADVEVGDIVYTSGLGSVYPRDLYIGKVISVSVDEYLRSKSATVELSVDLESLKYVMIITDYEIYSEEDTDEAS